MKFFNALNLSLVALLISFSNPSHAVVACRQVHTQDQAATRQDIVAELKDKKVPAVLMPGAGGGIPVVLMNAKTGPQMKSFLENSIGTIVAHQPDYKNDHGMLRFKNVMADMDLPGYRGRGELHANGLSWADLESYLNYARGRNTSIRVEVAFSLSRSEMQTTELYQRMRRASILRIKFSFGNATQNMDLPNFLRNGGEHCFIFCGGGALNSHVSEISSRFAQESGLGRIEEVLGRADVTQWMQKVETAMMDVNPNSARDLSPDLPIRTGVPESIANDPKFKAMDAQKKMETLNWLVAYKLTSNYSKLTDDLGFARDSGFGSMRSPRATAVLIYDGQVSPTDFMATTYQSPGIFSTWSNRNTTPILP